MKSFSEWLQTEESTNSYEVNESVYRIDSDRINDFNQNLRTYHHNKNWTHSGTWSDPKAVPDGYEQTQGLFGDDLKNVVPYAVPRNTPWILHWLYKRPTVVFELKDKQNIIKHRPYLSKFSDQNFYRLPSGEMFSKNPESPEHQEKIRNPLNFIKQWYNVVFVSNLETLARRFKRQGVLFDSEGLG